MKCPRDGAELKDMGYLAITVMEYTMWWCATCRQFRIGQWDSFEQRGSSHWTTNKKAANFIELSKKQDAHLRQREELRQAALKKWKQQQRKVAH